MEEWTRANANASICLWFWKNSCSHVFDFTSQLRDAQQAGAAGERGAPREYEENVGVWRMVFKIHKHSSSCWKCHPKSYRVNTDSGVYPNSCPVAFMCHLQDLAEKGELQKDPSPHGWVPVPNLWALSSCGCCTPNLALIICH